MYFYILNWSTPDEAYSVMGNKDVVHAIMDMINKLKIKVHSASLTDTDGNQIKHWIKLR